MLGQNPHMSASFGIQYRYPNTLNPGQEPLIDPSVIGDHLGYARVNVQNQAPAIQGQLGTQLAAQNLVNPSAQLPSVQHGPWPQAPTVTQFSQLAAQPQRTQQLQESHQNENGQLLLYSQYQQSLLQHPQFVNPQVLNTSNSTNISPAIYAPENMNQYHGVVNQVINQYYPSRPQQPQQQHDNDQNPSFPGLEPFIWVANTNANDANSAFANDLVLRAMVDIDPQPHADDEDERESTNR
jgi:hypothetical protein